MSPDHGDICRAVAGYGLRDAFPSLPSAPVDDATWTGILDHATGQRITGHLAHALHDGAFAATDSQRAAARERHERALALDLLLERLLLASVRTLRTAGIPVRVLKGAAIAHTVYPNPALRSFGDIDLLVPSGHYDSAVERLRVGRGRRRYQEPRSGFDRRFGKGVCIETPDGFEIDLHRTFVAGPFGLAVDTADLFATRSTFPLSDTTLDCLDLEGRFIHACFRASLGSLEPRLVPLRDVAQILQFTDVDTGRVRDLCARWRCGIVVQRATRLAWESFGLGVEGDVARWSRYYEPSSFEQRALEAYTGPNRSYARQAVAGLRAIRGVRAKAAYARALLAPDAAYVRERDGGYLRRFRRSVRLLVEGRARK